MLYITDRQTDSIQRDRRTRPTLCSDVVQESMNVWAMTDRTASMLSVTWTSNTNWGFFRMLTQNLRGRLGHKTTVSDLDLNLTS